MREKRILTIQDYSCLGRCSLTVAIPTISACGIECVGVPTAILSNHTQFDEWTFTDLSKDILPIVDMWPEPDKRFDAVYTGYLGKGQIGIVKEVMGRLPKNTLLFVDPAMADFGKLYSGFDEEHVHDMRELVAEADIVKPNLTEACLLIGIPYPDKTVLSYDEVLDICKKVHALGAKNVLLSGVRFSEKEIGVFSYNEQKGGTYFQKPLKEGNYHGTGDLFSSAFISAFVKGHDILKSAEIAHDFISDSIDETLKNGTDGLRYGVDFEGVLPSLIKALKN